MFRFKKTLRMISLALAVVMLVTAFCGCGSSGSAADNVKQLKDTTINGEKAVNLTFIRPGQSTDESDPVIKAIRKYEKMYGVKVQIISADYDTWTTKVMSASTSGMPIDVIFGSVSEYPLFAMKGYTQPVEKFVNLDSEYASRSASEAFFSFKDNIYCAAVSNVSPLVLYYNKDIIEAEGMEDPMDLYEQGEWTFDTFKEMCKKLTDDTDKDGNTDRWGLCCWYPWAWLGANHTALCNINKDGLYELNLSDPAVVQTSEFVQDMYYTSNWRGLDGDDIFTSFYQGRNAFLQEYSWSEVNRIIPAKKSGQFDFEYGVVPTPYGPNNKNKSNVAHASGYGIGNGSKSPYHSGKLIEMILESISKDADKNNKEVP
ncbi:MAG: extracellular solute-binding protein, partial [Clostridia bacterium]|nr:extracellular solute-binding protein [Clostridia bacterium]